MNRAFAVLLILILVAVSRVGEESDPPTLFVTTHCEDLVICYYDSYSSSRTYSCFRDADLVAKYCGEEDTP